MDESPAAAGSGLALGVGGLRVGVEDAGQVEAVEPRGGRHGVGAHLFEEEPVPDLQLKSHNKRWVD